MRPDTDIDGNARNRAGTYSGPGAAGAGVGTGAGAAARVVAVLEREGRVSLAGPWGAGKTTLLEEVLRTLSAPPESPARPDGPGRTVLRVTTVEGDQEHAFGALAQMLTHCTPAELGSLSGAQARVVDRILHRGAQDPLDASAQLPARIAVTALLGAGDRILSVDGAQWLDAASADVLGYALRTLAPPRLTAIITERVQGRAQAAARLLGGHPTQIDVPLLDPEETAALLCAHGLPTRWAGPLQSHCGGHPLLTSLSCKALAALPASELRRPAMPAQAVDAAETWLRATLSAPARHTLMLASLTSRPTLRLLLRAGRSDAEEHLAQARAAGVLRAAPAAGGPAFAGPAVAGPTMPASATTAPADAVQFPAEALAQAAARSEGRPRRVSAHLTLALAVGDPVHEVRHRALAADLPDQGLAEDTESAAATARGAGERALAAELFLLAAEITPPTRAALRIRRLSSAAQEAACAGSVDIARQAADALTATRADPADQVTALLALFDAHGQALAGLEPLLARCRELAAGHPELLAAVELRAAIAANLAHGAPGLALRAATRAAELAAVGGHRPLQAAALTMRARMERVLGAAEAPDTLTRALALGIPAQHFGIRNSAQYLAARHAVFDDRLREARERLVELLALADHEGEAEDLVDIWRSLAEVDTRLGACAPALAWADRAVRLSTTAGLSMGPAWYTAALTQSAAGSFAAALRTAACGARASQEEGDGLYVARNLWVMGAVQLHTGDAAGAVASLTAVAEAEEQAPAADPGMFRWRPDAVEALTCAGHLTRARELLDRARPAEGPPDPGTGPGRDSGPAPGPGSGPRAALDRAHGILLARTGAGDEAAELLSRAAAAFEGLHLPLEQARTLLALGRAERSRRRQAAARTAWEAAQAVFDGTGARPWQELTRELLDRAGGAAPAGTGPAAGASPRGTRLTDSESRLADLVCQGVTNQQAAQYMFISVKTVEGMLSRIYRKLGVRSRTQLAAALTATRAGGRAPQGPCLVRPAEAD
ncbi:LuxR family transcriptional regulator [Streptomyces sp. NBC_00503]|uniref:LuxR family transcriptional regulator n=1 Tax=Streptomyces sp. NBC_00503 TaxID=2903659 RepID=UPI002E8087D9|nr:LuxR family transcriptional regulator [Streptomyces sp. NBC_00503]WUD79503.1 LuxR family transcriptional regulator [Streptomyces sp. NBC_00503]